MGRAPCDQLFNFILDNIAIQGYIPRTFGSSIYMTCIVEPVFYEKTALMRFCLWVCFLVDRRIIFAGYDYLQG